MAAIFPEQMDRLHLEDVQGSLRILENYVRYMTERMEFANSNTNRFFAESGTSNAAVIKAVLTISDRVSVIEASTQGVLNNVQALVNRVTELNNSVSALGAEVESLKQRVSTLEGGTEA